MKRRDFVDAAAAASVFSIVPRHVLGAPFVPPSDKITIGHIGMGTQSFKEIGSLLANPRVQIVSVCDPNRDSSDYVEWGKGDIRRTIARLIGDSAWRANAPGCPGGREIGREAINAYYARERGKESFRGCSAYADFREMLAKEKVDGVKIMTPDHLHATVAIAAMKKGIHVEVHKPLANRLQEARMVIDTARRTKVATHFLPYGSGDAMRFLTSRIKEGVIGTLREVHNWSNRPMWPQYTEIPIDKPPVPAGFEWDLWLGPALDRPYNPRYTHAVFRGWYDFGGGSLADMGHYSLWPVFTAFELGSPVSVQPRTTHTCTVVDGVSRRVNNDFSFPTACTLRFRFEARRGMPELDLFWYDGGMKPRVPQDLEADFEELPIEGILFVGDEGKIVAGFTGQNPQIYPKSRASALGTPPTRPPRSEGAPARDLWIDSIAGKEPSPGSFLNAGAISDMVNLGAIALRTGKKIMFDSANMKITNVPEANKYLTREYRKGWELKSENL